VVSQSSDEKQGSWESARAKKRRRQNIKGSPPRNIDKTEDRNKFLGHDATNIVLYLPYKLKSLELSTIEFTKTERGWENTQSNDREPFIKSVATSLFLE
jgi:hypothetical protein